MMGRTTALLFVCFACTIVADPPAALPQGVSNPKQKEEIEVGHIVIVCYHPKPGKETALLDLVRNHVPILRAQGLATDRAPVVMRSQDGTIVEVFEWKSKKATDDAHNDPAVQAMWQKFSEACDFDTIGNLPEAKQLFSGFEAVNLDR